MNSIHLQTLGLYFEHLLDPIVTILPSSEIVFCNNSFSALADKPTKRLTGKPLFDFITTTYPLASILDRSNELINGKYIDCLVTAHGKPELRMHVHAQWILIESLGECLLLTMKDMTAEASLHERYRLQLQEKEGLISKLDSKIFELEFILELLSISLNQSENEHAPAIVFETILKKVPALELSMISINPNSQPYSLTFVANHKSEQMGETNPNRELPGPLIGSIYQLELNTDSSKSIEVGPLKLDSKYTLYGIIHQGKDLNWHLFSFKFENSKVDFFTSHSSFLSSVTQQALMVLENQLLYLRSITDDKTHLYNHRYFEHRFENEVRRAQRYRSALSFLIIDIDSFKLFNDTHGHLEGDRIIVKVAEVLKSHFRNTDIVARYGGDEFVAILTETNMEGAKIAAQRLVQKIREISHVTESGVSLGITTSIGVSNFPEHGSTGAELMDAADKALYEAKRLGRNQSCIAK